MSRVTCGLGLRGMYANADTTNFLNKTQNAVNSRVVINATRTTEKQQQQEEEEHLGVSMEPLWLRDAAEVLITACIGAGHGG